MKYIILPGYLRSVHFVQSKLIDSISECEISSFTLKCGFKLRYFGIKVLYSARFNLLNYSI